MENPDDAMKLNINPGTHRFHTKGKAPEGNQKMAAGEVWGVILILDGEVMVEQIY